MCSRVDALFTLSQITIQGYCYAQFSFRFGRFASVRSVCVFCLLEVCINEIIPRKRQKHATGFRGSTVIAHFRSGPVQLPGLFIFLYFFAKLNNHSSPRKRQNHVLSVRGSLVIDHF